MYAYMHKLSNTQIASISNTFHGYLIVYEINIKAHVLSSQVMKCYHYGYNNSKTSSLCLDLYKVPVKNC
jgi:hypothetical protein